MNTIPYLKVPWKIKNAKADNAAVLLKNINFSRWDLEEIYLEEDEEKVRYKSKIKVLASFDVYPDLECFQRRILPMTAFSLNWIIGPEDVETIEDFIDPDYLFRKVKESKFPGDVVGSEVDLSEGVYLYGHE